jgi:hypothetical protein
VSHWCLGKWIENTGKHQPANEETSGDVWLYANVTERLQEQKKRKKSQLRHCTNVRTGSSIKEEEERDSKANKRNRRKTYTHRDSGTRGERENRYACASEFKNNSIHGKEKTLLGPGRRGRVGVYRCIYCRCVSTRWQKPVRSGRWRTTLSLFLIYTRLFLLCQLETTL